MKIESEIRNKQNATIKPLTQEKEQKKKKKKKKKKQQQQQQQQNKTIRQRNRLGTVSRINQVVEDLNKFYSGETLPLILMQLRI